MGRFLTNLERWVPLQKANGLLWILLLVSIPFTSSPLVAFFTGGSTVSPLAGIPLILLFTFWYVPNFLRSRNIPKVSVPLLLFFGVALLSTILATYLKHYPFQGQESLDRGFRALLAAERR